MKTKQIKNDLVRKIIYVFIHRNNDKTLLIIVKLRNFEISVSIENFTKIVVYIYNYTNV